MPEIEVTLRVLHPKQQEIINNLAKRTVIRAGRRSGKTTLASDIAVNRFLDGGRVLYAVPTDEQVERFWFECKRALGAAIDAGILYKNEVRHIIEIPRTEQRIRAKTAWNADTLRGDYADLLILDEYQLMKKNAWKLVGAPMLLDNDGDAIFIYTSKRGKYHAKELYSHAEKEEGNARQSNEPSRWRVFKFTSHDNPHLNETALDEITQDMTSVNYRMEILAEEMDDDPRALWNRDLISRELKHPPLARVVVGVDPPGSAEGAECGIVTAGRARKDGSWHTYVLADGSLHGTPGQWGMAVVAAYHGNDADRVAAEANFGGDMVESTIHTVGGDSVAVKLVHASRGKQMRAEPIVALYERGLVHHVGEFGALEDEMCTWVPGTGMPSPNRIDALVWALTELMTGYKEWSGTWSGRTDANDEAQRKRRAAQEGEQQEQAAAKKPGKPASLQARMKRASRKRRR